MNSNNQKKIRPNKDRQAKFDWPSEEEEFFDSKFQEAKAYFESKYGKWDGNIARHCKGWGKRKRAWRLQEVQTALQNLQTDRVLSLKRTNDDIISIAEREIDYMKRTGKINVKNLMRLWEMIRTESGLPKSILHNLNDNMNIDLSSARDSLVAKVNKAIPKK